MNEPIQKRLRKKFGQLPKWAEDFSADYPGILVRLEEEKFVAYGQKCSHLQAPVLWKEKEHKFFCPCHRGSFSVETGDVLAGPPERPLPKLKLRVTETTVYFDGIEKGRLV